MPRDRTEHLEKWKDNGLLTECTGDAAAKLFNRDAVSSLGEGEKLYKIGYFTG